MMSDTAACTSDSIREWIAENLRRMERRHDMKREGTPEERAQRLLALPVAMDDDEDEFLRDLAAGCTFGIR